MRRQRGGNVGELECVDRGGPQCERTQIVLLEVVGQALLALAGSTRIGVRAQAETNSDVHRRSHPDVLEELDECGVGGLGQCLRHRQLCGIPAVVAHTVGVRRATVDTAAATHALRLEGGRNLKGGPGTQALFHRRGDREDLEHRPRTVADHRERLRLHGLVRILVESVLATRRHRHDVVALCARPDHAHDSRDTVEVRVGDVLHPGQRRPLDGGIERGADGVSAAGDRLAAQAVLGQELQRVVAEETGIGGRDAAVGQGDRGGDHAERGLLGGLVLGRAIREVGDQRVENQVAAFEHTIGVVVGVECRTRLHHAGEHRRLGDRQILRGLVEVRASCGLDAVGAVTERHHVQVAGDDFFFGLLLGLLVAQVLVPFGLLGEVLLQRECHADFFELARGRCLGGGATVGVGAGENQQLVVLHILLVDGRSTLLHLARRRVLEERADRAFPVHPVVVEETPVFD